MRHTKIRSIGPAFFDDEEVVQLSMEARLLLIGISNLTDDQGVFRWKPVTFKSHVFPMDALDIHALLQELESHDLVRKFEADGSAYGAMRGWGRHQKPKDPKGEYPLPPELDEYVRLAEITPPRVRQDRAEPEWPLRPRSAGLGPAQTEAAEVQNRPEGVKNEGSPQAAAGAPPAAAGGPRHATGRHRGEEGSGGERRGEEREARGRAPGADAPLAPASPSDEPPDPGLWPGTPRPAAVKALHDAYLVPLERHALGLEHLAKHAKPRDLHRGIVQAVIRLGGLKPDNPTLHQQLAWTDSRRDKTRGAVRAWLSKVNASVGESTGGRSAFTRACLQRGPCPGWELPRFGKQPKEPAA